MKLSFLVLLTHIALALSADSPTELPTELPSLQPTVVPTVEPSLKPTLHPTVEPSLKPTVVPSEIPTVVPTVEPSLKPTVHPSVEPSLKPTVVPSELPTVAPTVEPSLKPTVHPTVEPSLKPTVAPSVAPSLHPTTEPSLKPTVAPSVAPSLHPTTEPSLMPTVHPTVEPSLKPTVAPSVAPSLHPTTGPSVKPTVHPTVEPSLKPTVAPSVAPSLHPTTGPSVKPSVHPTVEPSASPSLHPTVRPSVTPSVHPTLQPTVEPSIPPTQPPSHHPTISGPGWLLESYYYDGNDISDPLVVYGTRTQTCLPISSYVQTILEDSGIEYYYKYSCGDGYVQFQMYSDADCLNAIHQDDVSFKFEQNKALSGIGFNFHAGPHFYREWYMMLGYVEFQCVDSADQYSFTDGQNYAVIEYFPSEEVEQCTTDTYTQFAAYQKDYCFGIYKGYYNRDNDDDGSHEAYYQFTSSDDTFISLTAYYEDSTCSSESEYFVKNIFPIDTCDQNFYQSYTPDVKKKEKQLVEKQNHASNPFKFDSNTPTMMKHMMTKSFVKAQGKEFVPFHEKMSAKGAEWNKKKRGAVQQRESQQTKKTNAVFDDNKVDDDYRGFRAEYGNVYFHDDNYEDDYGAGVTVFDDEEYYNDFLPGFSLSPALSEYYQWSNVPAETNGSSLAKWFTEVLSYDDVPALVSTRQTLTCMPYGNGDIWFNYMVVCEDGFVHTLYYDDADISCQGDYRIQSKSYSEFFDDGNTGRKDYWYLSPNYDCSNVMFSENFWYAVNDDEQSYATEFFYSLNSDSECISSDASTSDVTMGVAILEDHCFTITANVGELFDDPNVLGLNDDDVVVYSAKYWVDQEDNNQNIQFTVWQSAQCNDKFVTQTKEIEINTCYDYQPNTVFQTTFEPFRRLNEMSERQVKAHNQQLASFEQHNTMDTPFNVELASKSPKALHKKHSAMKETADKDVEWFYDYYYHYSDAGETFFNNRMLAQKNQWFTLPTSATISPSEVPTMSPSQPPSRHPTVEPSVEPSQPPTVLPTIRPTLAPNPPTQRPTPAVGMPTASPSHQVTYTFSVTQNLDGIDATTFNSDENNAIAFINALTMAMPPLVADNFAISDVSDEVGARRLRALTAEAVDIMYWVTYTVAETGYNDAETAYAALIASLNTSVVLDLFDGYIQVSAEDKDAPDLLPTTTSSFTASPATQVGTDDDSKPLTDNHHKVIVGVLVGLGGGLLLIAVIAWCIFGRGEDSGASQRHSNPQSLEMTFADRTPEKIAL